MDQEMNSTMLEETAIAPETVEEVQEAEQTTSSVNESTLNIPIEEVSFDVEKERKKQRVFNILKNIFVYGFLTACAVFAFLPFFWMFIASLKDEHAYRDPTAPFFPDRIMWENYEVVFNQTSSGVNFTQIMVNTLVVGVLSTVLGLVIIIITAYALARMNFKGKNLLFTLMLGTMMIPGEMYTLTNYLTVSPSQLNWVDTYTVLIVPFLVSVYYIYLLRNNFMQIPNSLYQAAKVDGLSDFGYLVKVMIPLTAPTLISIALLKFIGTWNSYIWPQLINNQPWQMITNWVMWGFNDNKGVLYGPTGVMSQISSYGSEPLTTLKMAAVCLVSSPLLVLFVFCRKYIMRGVSKSGTKG